MRHAAIGRHDPDLREGVGLEGALPKGAPAVRFGLEVEQREQPRLVRFPEHDVQLGDGKEVPDGRLVPGVRPSRSRTGALAEVLTSDIEGVQERGGAALGTADPPLSNSGEDTVLGQPTQHSLAVPGPTGVGAVGEEQALQLAAGHELEATDLVDNGEVSRAQLRR